MWKFLVVESPLFVVALVSIMNIFVVAIMPVMSIFVIALVPLIPETGCKGRKMALCFEEHVA